MRISNKNLRLCVLNRFLARAETMYGSPSVKPVHLIEAAREIGELDPKLSALLLRAFEQRKLPMPVEDAMGVIDTYLEHREEP